MQLEAPATLGSARQLEINEASSLIVNAMQAIVEPDLDCPVSVRNLQYIRPAKRSAVRPAFGYAGNVTRGACILARCLELEDPRADFAAAIGVIKFFVEFTAAAIPCADKVHVKAA